MNINAIALLLLVYVAFIISGCAAGTGGFLENDVLAPEKIAGRNQDRNLTQTTAISFTGIENAIAPELLLETINGRLPFVNKCDDLAGNKTELGITVFTPDDLDRVTPDTQDRPYASLLYLTSGHISECTRDEETEAITSIIRTSLTFGILGSSLAEDTQRWLHITAGVSPRIPNGWENQISDGGDLTAMYATEFQKKIFESRIGPGLPVIPKLLRKFQLSYSLGARVGYYTDISVGLDSRVLLNQKEFCTQFYDVGGSRIDAGQEAPTNNPCGNDRFVFFGARSRATAYNALLQGWVRDSKHEFSSDEIERYVTTYTLGYSDSLEGLCRTGRKLLRFINCRKSGINDTRITFAIHKREAEYDAGVKGRSHSWGGLYFSRKTNI